MFADIPNSLTNFKLLSSPSFSSSISSTKRISLAFSIPFGVRGIANSIEILRKFASNASSSSSSSFLVSSNKRSPSSSYSLSLAFLISTGKTCGRFRPRAMDPIDRAPHATAHAATVVTNVSASSTTLRTIVSKGTRRATISRVLSKFFSQVTPFFYVGLTFSVFLSFFFLTFFFQKNKKKTKKKAIKNQFPFLFLRLRAFAKR